jgi:predicted transcriptional regulator of viral defense system
MLKTTAMILQELQNYASPADKLTRLVKNGVYIPVVHGLYETDRSTPGYLLAGSIYGPSYLSFEFALAYHGLIPEAVYTFTCATFAKKKKKTYQTPFGNFTYQDVPAAAYPYGLQIKKEGAYAYVLAAPEKALCDQLYKIAPVHNYDELSKLLFEDLRLDEQELKKLRVDDIAFLAARYSSTTIKKLSGFLRRL